MNQEQNQNQVEEEVPQKEEDKEVKEKSLIKKKKIIPMLVGIGIIALIGLIIGVLVWHFARVPVVPEVGIVEKELKDEIINPCLLTKDIDIKFTTISSICYNFRQYKERGYDFCETDYKYRDSNLCYAYVAIAKQDIEKCDELEHQKNFCYAGLATVLADESICEKISYSEENYNRRDKCFINLAVIKKEPKLCEKIGYDFQKDACYAAMAVHTNNELFCRYIENSQWYKNNCYREFRKEFDWDNFTIPELTEWKTYRNEEYGFEFKYLPNLLVIDTGKLQYYRDERDIFSLSFPDLFSSISVVPNSNIFCNDDKEIIGNNVISTTNVFSKMAESIIYYGIWTNKDYGFVIEESHSIFPKHYILDDMRINIIREIVNSFRLINNVESIECH